MTVLCHYYEVYRQRVTVCGVRKAIAGVETVDALLLEPTPCPRCLEWVVEQGQLATRRLEVLQSKQEPHR